MGCKDCEEYGRLLDQARLMRKQDNARCIATRCAEIAEVDIINKHHDADIATCDVVADAIRNEFGLTKTR